MLKKVYRIPEREVKKVLRMKKPFFSYGLTALFRENRLGHPRFALVIGGKTVSGSVERNFFRRLFYTTVQACLEQNLQVSTDCVFLVKKQNKLSMGEPDCVNSFRKELNFLCKKIFVS